MARRMMFAARADGELPKGYADGLALSPRAPALSADLR